MGQSSTLMVVVSVEREVGVDISAHVETEPEGVTTLRRAYTSD